MSLQDYVYCSREVFVLRCIYLLTCKIITIHAVLCYFVCAVS